MKFSSTNQPSNRGRKATGQKPTMRIAVTQDIKEWYQARKGTALVALQEYMRTCLEEKSKHPEIPMPKFNIGDTIRFSIKGNDYEGVVTTAPEWLDFDYSYIVKDDKGENFFVMENDVQ